MEFEKEKPERVITEIVTIHPTTIFGPAIIHGHIPERTVLESMHAGKPPNITKENLGFVDVRDVAQAYIQAIKVKAAKNKRFIISANDYKFKETMEIFFPSDKRIKRTSKSVYLSGNAVDVGYNRPITEEKEERANPRVLVNNHASRNILKMVYRPLNVTYMDMIDSLRY